MTTLDLTGVALQTYDDDYFFDFDPYAHQLELLRLFRDSDRFVAVNDSPTGGGKTSSWLAPVLDDARDAIAIYPTNALIEDQKAAIDRIATNEVDHEVAVLKATASSIDEISDQFNADSKGAILDNWLRKKRRSADQRILLTNPDIFVMMRRDLYNKKIREYKNFEVAVVDEFHRADRKEQNTLRFLIDEMQSEDDDIVALSQVAFLSATPDARQERLFKRAMEAPYHRVTNSDSEERRSFVDPPGEDWVGVMPPVELDVRTASTFSTADILLNEAEDTLSFCRNGRTVIILDGIHEVSRIHSWLDEQLDSQVERIDGFYSRNKTKKLKNFDVLVSNSAVEVGIDFNVDRLLFAGPDRNSFLQRLGRLRKENNFHQARCYVPQSVADMFSAHEGETVTREQLDHIVAEAYPEPRDPETFDARYSAAEAFDHLDHRLQNAPPDEVDAIKSETVDRIERHFQVGTDTEFSLRDMEAFTKTLDWRILTALQWYRGDNIQSLVYDRKRDQVTTYDMFYLLRYGDVEFLDRHEFEEIIPDNQKKHLDHYGRYVEGFCKYDGIIQTNEEGFGRNVFFTGGVLHQWIDGTTDRSRKPQMKSGFKLDVDPNGTGSRVPSISKVNDKLRERRSKDGIESGLLCYPVNGYPSRVKRQYNLNEFFFLYPVRVQGQEVHSLAIGTDALYLHCHIIEQSQQLSSGVNKFI
jgi:CRISPR-associated endonuclease/helicase Cas3